MGTALHREMTIPPDQPLRGVSPREIEAVDVEEALAALRVRFLISRGRNAGEWVGFTK
jgi:hypothetical protein